MNALLNSLAFSLQEVGCCRKVLKLMPIEAASVIMTDTPSDLHVAIV
jgi:hypothetical protein